MEAGSWTNRGHLCHLLLYPALACNQSPSRIPVVVVLTTGRNVTSPRRSMSRINHLQTGHGRATTKSYLDSVITIKIVQLCSHPQGFGEPACRNAIQSTRLSNCMPPHSRENKPLSTFQWTTTMAASRQTEQLGTQIRQEGGRQSLSRWPVRREAFIPNRIRAGWSR